MTYRAVSESAYAFGYDEARDKPAGVKGVLLQGGNEIPAGTALEGVLFESESLDQVMNLATAWRDAHPGMTAYVCDDRNRVVQIVWRMDFSKENAAEAESARKWFRIGLASVLVLNAVIASAYVFFKAGHPIVPAISAIVALELAYAGIVKLKIANEIESLHITLILSVLVWTALAIL